MKSGAKAMAWMASAVASRLVWITPGEGSRSSALALTKEQCLNPKVLADNSPLVMPLETQFRSARNGRTGPMVRETMPRSM